jgi:hypothetical protein
MTGGGFFNQNLQIDATSATLEFVELATCDVIASASLGWDFHAPWFSDCDPNNLQGGGSFGAIMPGSAAVGAPIRTAGSFPVGPCPTWFIHQLGWSMTRPDAIGAPGVYDWRLWALGALGDYQSLSGTLDMSSTYPDGLPCGYIRINGLRLVGLSFAGYLFVAGLGGCVGPSCGDFPEIEPPEDEPLVNPFPEVFARPCYLYATVFDDDRLTLLWQVSNDPTHPYPYLIDPGSSQYGAQEIDPIEGRSSITEVTIRVLDPATIAGDQDSGWLTARLKGLRERRVRVERGLPDASGTIVLADGPASSPRMV